MPRTATAPRSLRGGSRTDSFEIISSPPKHPAVRVLALIVRLRAELLIVAVCLTVWFTLRHNLSLPATITIYVAVPVVLVCLPWSRRYLLRRAAAVVTRHRLRQTLVECRVLNHSRACPLLLWSHPTKVGETVWLLLRAGISAEDVEGQAAWIAAGCFAREARVVPRPSMTALVRVEVIRRDPLAPESIDSDLSPWAAGWDSPVIPVGASRTPPVRPGSRPPMPTVVDGDVVTPAETADVDRTAPAGAPASNGNDHGPADRGEDWSDYV